MRDEAFIAKVLSSLISEAIWIGYISMCISSLLKYVYEHILVYRAVL